MTSFALLGVLGLLTLGAALLGASAFPSPSQPNATRSEPTSDIVEVTGYQHLSEMDGSTRPVTVVLQGNQAVAIRAALAGLSPTPPAVCMENTSLFKISFLAHPGGAPTGVATEEICPTPGVVNLSVDGKPTQHLEEDCALQVAVVSSLPKGQAEGTRRDEFGC